MRKTAAPGSKMCQNGKVVAVGVDVGLARDMWSVIAGFLKDHHMEAAAGCRKDLCVSPGCWDWVPLEHRDAVLNVRGITDRVGEGNVKGKLGRRVMGSTIGAGLGKGSFPVWSASWMQVCGPALAVPAVGICGLPGAERNRVALAQRG